MLRVGCFPLLFAAVSPFVQAARQDAEQAPLGQGWPIGACRQTNGGTEGTRRRRANKRGRRLLVTLGLSKVTRPAAQRRRNPVEDGVLASCMAKPCQYLVAGQRRYRTPHPSPLPQGERGSFTPVQCASLIGTLPVSSQGRGERFPVQCAPLIGTLPVSRKGRGDCYLGAMRFAYWHPICLPQGRGERFPVQCAPLIAPCASSRGGRGALPLLGAHPPGC
jgi:hypothetical protein